MKGKIAIIGTGFSGLQLAAIFAKSGCEVTAFDMDVERIEELDEKKRDPYCLDHDFSHDKIHFTSNPNHLLEATTYIAAVPTPLNPYFVPDLSTLKNVSKVIGKVLKKMDLVIFVSTVFPGATEELLIPIMEEECGLQSGRDFYVGYSLDRSDNGDPEHGIAQEINVIAGENAEVLQKIKLLFHEAGLKTYCAPTIKVAEASKLIESIQRDVNIALMNEYAQIMEKMSIPIYDVLKTAQTKWNFLPFKPGLVGGLGIPVDPYYLIYRANGFGINPNLISISRQINEQFIHFIANSLLRLLNQQKLSAHESKVVICGISYKANVSEARHSLSIKLYNLLEQYGLTLYAFDPCAKKQDLQLKWVDWEEVPQCEAIILVQPHDAFLKIGIRNLCTKLKENTVFMDIPGIFCEQSLGRDDIINWSL
jgi:UDP-N-acetyl-D-galactosamine dehydrogenase